MSNQSHASAVVNGKSRWQLYLELTRFIKAPVGTVLVVVPGCQFPRILRGYEFSTDYLWAVWSVTMCAYNRRITAVWLVEALLMSAGVNILRRAGACVWNDICDKDLDRHVGQSALCIYQLCLADNIVVVARSKNRPVASGAVSVKEAFVLFLALSVLEFAAFWFIGVKQYVA